MDVLSVDQLAAEMLPHACHFVEFYEPHHMKYCREQYDYVGPDPVKFHPGVGDKMILLQTMREAASIVFPAKARIILNARRYAHLALMKFYYPVFDSQNRTQILE